MNQIELAFYKAGIQDAKESRSSVCAARSKRYMELAEKHPVLIGTESVKRIKAYDAGVQFYMNRWGALSERSGLRKE